MNVEYTKSESIVKSHKITKGRANTLITVLPTFSLEICWLINKLPAFNGMICKFCSFFVKRKEDSEIFFFFIQR